MAPGGGGKRKRGDRSYSGDSRDDGLRPAPHRPDSLSLAQRIQQYPQQSPTHGRGGYNDRGRGNRRGSRGGFPAGFQRSPAQSPSTTSQHTRAGNESVAPPSPQANKNAPPAQPDSHVQNPSAQAVPSSQEEQQEKEPSPVLLPLDYDHVTDDVIGRWSESGREEILSKAREARDAGDSLALVDIYQELIRTSVESRKGAEDCGSLVHEFLCQPTPDHIGEPSSDTLAFDPSSHFLDALTIFVEAYSFSPSVRALVEATGIPAQKIRREADPELVENLGLIRSTFNKIGIRQQTNRIYRQRNYNLLREESEGYSKLVTEFFTTSNNEPPTSEIVEDTFERVRGMIGAFDLDVGRVLDITLDVFAAVLVKQYRFFVKYLRASSWWPQDSFAASASAQSCLGPLPRWALPGLEGRPMTEEEKEESSALRNQRDEKFWQRCREVGLAAFYELGDRRPEEQLLQAASNEAASSNATNESEDRKWIDITHTLPPAGNKIAAQVLGFKLRFYTSDVRDASDVFPVNLIYLAALLIKIGFISLRDLYPHIWPQDPDMEKLKDEKMKEKAERQKANRPGGGTNALLAAAPLPDDTVEGSTRESTRLREAEATRRLPKSDAASRSSPSVQPEEKQELPEPTEQKVQLLKSLLCIGALPESLYMLGRFPWLPDAFPELPEYIHRILHHCISKVYEDLRPLKDEGGLRQQQQMADTEQAGIPKGQIRLVDMPPRKTMRWAQLDKDDTSEAVDYRFYWDDWADILPVCQNVDDIFTLCSTLLNYSGVKIGQDPTLLLKLARIGSYSLTSDASEANFVRWTELSKRLLVPALSLTKCNPGVVNEVFELIKHFSEPTRYNMYAEWNSGQISRLPDIRSAFEQTKAETRDVLKRISKTTIRPMARALAKVTYASPGVVFSVAISQLESYENIVDTFVECARYFTYLAYDVLTWSLMSQLGAQGRNRLQSDGLLTSKWLASLALFSGKVFKRYSVMNPLPIVQYVEHQLRQGNPTDLIVLEDITRSMAGIISDVSYNEAQVLAMGGGDLMQSQTLQQLMDRRHESKTTARRLMKPLIDSRLAGQVLISLAQERQMCIFRVEEENAHPKLLGNLLDQIQRVLGQYLELLRSNLSVQDFDDFVPGVSRLITDFGVDPSIAFWLARQSINHAIDVYDAAHAKHEPVLDKPATNGNIDVKGDDTQQTNEPQAEAKDGALHQVGSVNLASGGEKVKPVEKDGVAAQDGEGAATSQDVEMRTETDDPEALPTAQTETSKPKEAAQSCHPVLQTIAKNIKPALPSGMWDALDPAFYVTFWHLSLSDINVHLASYKDEHSRLADKKKAILADRTDVSVSGSKKKQQEIKTLDGLMEDLTSEMKKRMTLKQVPRLRLEKNYWFSGSWGKYDERHVALIEHCFFPRLTMSPLDSHYTFRMIKWLHKEATANFRTMGLYDQFFREKRLTSMIFLCSSKEAECLGRFINDVLKDFNLWHADKALYEKEAHGPKKNFVGFSTKKAKNAEGKEEHTFLGYEDFRRLLLKWHRSLNGALKACYASGEYMHIRNAINVLNNIHQHFPVVNWMGSVQVSSISELSEKETREDLKIAATSLIGALKKREKHWIMPQAFCLNDGQAPKSGQRGNSARPATPQSSSSEVTKLLNPKAPEFKPSPQPAANGDTSKVAAGKTDAEDGEIDDAQAVDVPSKSEMKPEQLASSSPIADSRQPTPASAKPAETANGTGKERPVATASVSKSAPVPNRPQPARTRSSNLTNGQADLPTRPDPPPLRHVNARGLARLEDRSHVVQSRDTRGAAKGGLDGPHDVPVIRGSDRHTSGPPLRGAPADSRYGRPSPDDGFGRSSRDARAQLPDDRTGALPNGRALPETVADRRDLITGQRGREALMAPPENKIPHHPDRAALIRGHSVTDRDARFPVDRQGPMGLGRRSRGSSPVRADTSAASYDRNRAPLDTRHPYDDRLSQAPYDDASAPTGPRSDRPPTAPPNDRFRDSMRPPHAAAAASDPQYGRLRQEPPSHRQSESYGRLNTDHDVPSGPRLANGNASSLPLGGRNVTGNAPSFNAQQPAMGVDTSPQTRQAPNGPGLRSSPRNQPPPSQLAPAATTAGSPTTEVAGVHPDRLRNLQGTAAPSPPTRPGPATRGGRLPPSPVSQASPNEQLPSSAGPPPRGPPTGPADRRGDKRFTQLQGVLQQSNQPPPDRSQGTSIRGRGARVNSIPSPSTSGPPTPSSSFPPSDTLAGRTVGPPVPVPNEEDARYPRGGPRHGPSEPERRPTRRDRSPGRDRGDFRAYEMGMQPSREDPRDRFRNDNAPPPMSIRGNAGPGDMRGPPPMERGGPPRRGGAAREEMQPRGEPERRDSQEWGPSGGDRRAGARDGGGSLRKRGRMDDGFDRGGEKRLRR